MAGWSCLYYRTKEENVILNLPQNAQEIQQQKKLQKIPKKLRKTLVFEKQNKRNFDAENLKRNVVSSRASQYHQQKTNKKKRMLKKKKKKEEEEDNFSVYPKSLPLLHPPPPPPPSPRSWERFCFPNIGRTRKTTKPVNTDKLQR